MGWTSYHAKYYKSNGTVDRKKELDELYTWKTDTKSVSVVKSSMVGSVYYGAIKVETDGETEIHGTVVVTQGKDRRDPWFNFAYRDMEESMGPYYYDCPKGILDLLSPTDNENALEWRKKCREKRNKPKLTDLPVGTQITFEHWNGEKYILEKMAPNFQFKRNWWYRAETNTYVPSIRIPADFTVLD